MIRGAAISEIFFKALVVIFLGSTFLVACDKSYTRPHGGSISDFDVKYAGIFYQTAPNDSSDVYGNVTATFNSLSGMLNYKISWHLLSSLPISMHINDAGPVIFEINNFPARISADYSGSATLTITQAYDLANGYIYLLIQTQKYPDGEIMAALTKKR